MAKIEVLVDEFEKIRDAVYPAVSALSLEELGWRPAEGSNSIAWLVWHLSRVQDEAVADLTGLEPAWTASGWFDRFGLPLHPADTGYGHDPRTAGTVRAPAAHLLDYFEEVHLRSVAWVSSLDEMALSEVADPGDQSVTVADRLVGVIVDDLQHVGQAAYVRGLLQRREAGTGLQW